MKNIFRYRADMVIIAVLVSVIGVSFFVDLEKHSEFKIIGLDQILPKNVLNWELEAKNTPKEIMGEILYNEMHQGMYFQQNGGNLSVTMEYSSDSRRKYEPHFPDICHAVRGDKVAKFTPLELALNGKKGFSAALLSWEYEAKSQQALCAYWYVVGGKPISSSMHLKRRQFWAGIFGTPEDSILIRFDFFYENAVSFNEIEEKKTVLKTFIEAFYLKLDDQQRRILYGD